MAVNYQHFDTVLSYAGYSNPTLIEKGDRWQIWKTHRTDPLGVELETHVVFLNSRATWQNCDQAYDGLLRHQLSNVSVLVQNSASVARDRDRLGKRMRTQRVRTVRRFLAESLGSTLRDPGDTRLTGDSEHAFVDPYIQTRDRTQTAAEETLLTWLKAEEETSEGGALAAVIGPGAVGKTTLARRLAQQLWQDHQRFWRFPVLIDADTWVRLLSQKALTLKDIVREATNQNYSCAVPTEHMETCVEHGVLVPIFDGFDELCTRRDSPFVASEILNDLHELIKETEARVLLTSRDGFWREFVEAGEGLEETYVGTRFYLQPFDESQRSRYVHNRFPNHEDEPTRNDANQILSEIQKSERDLARGGAPVERTVTGIPLVVALACDMAGTAETAQRRIPTRPAIRLPLDDVLYRFFQREQLRRKLPEALDASGQFRVFTNLASELGQEFDEEFVDLLVQDECPQATDQVRAAIRSSILLGRRNQTSLHFQYDFIYSHLAARGLARALLSSGRIESAGPVHRLLRENARGGTEMLEVVSDYIYSAQGADWQRTLADRARELWPQLQDDAKSGLFHLTRSLTRRTDSIGDEVTTLNRILNQGSGERMLNGIPIKGGVDGLDLRGAELRDLRFEGVFLIGCKFDSRTLFKNCRFDSYLELQGAHGIKFAQFADCVTSATARGALQGAGAGSRFPTHPEQIREALRDNLRKLRPGTLFRGTKSSARFRGAGGRVPFAEELWDSLEKEEVIEYFPQSGDRRGGVKVKDEAKKDVNMLLENNVVSGTVSRAYARLERRCAK